MIILVAICSCCGVAVNRFVRAVRPGKRNQNIPSNFGLESKEKDEIRIKKTSFQKKLTSQYMVKMLV